MLSQAVSDSFFASHKSSSSAGRHRKGWRGLTSSHPHEFQHNPLSTAGSHRLYPTEIIQHKHRALLSSSSFVCLFCAPPPSPQSLPVWIFSFFPIIVSLSSSCIFFSYPLCSLSLSLGLFSSHVPKRRCSRDSHHNPVSCPLNAGQAHTPRSPKVPEITHPHKHQHANVHAGPSEKQWTIIIDLGEKLEEKKSFPNLISQKGQHTHTMWQSVFVKSQFSFLGKILSFAVLLCSRRVQKSRPITDSHIATNS